MSELKPCPFCGGGKAHLVVHEDDGGYRATIYCTSGAEIGCFTKMSHWALKKSWVTKSATEAWNRRAQPANEPLTLEQLREMDGEPVFIILPNDVEDNQFWIIRHEWTDTNMCGRPALMLHMKWYLLEDCGKTWIAYRRPPERSENE